MNTKLKILGSIIWLLLLVWGGVGVIQRLTQGHLFANYGSYVPWGLWVAGKIYFVGLAVGASFLAWLTYAFDLQRLRPLVRPALLLSLVTMASGLLVISFDLGHMFRIYEVFLRPNFTSLLAISTWLSMIYLLFVFVVLVAEFRGWAGGSVRARVVGWVGIFFALMFSGANGAEFATLISSPYWHSALGPILSIGGALFSGFALVLAVTALFQVSPDRASLDTLRKMVAALLLFVLLLEWSEYSISMWYARGEEFNLLYSILFGHYWYVFWILHLLLGSIMSLILLLWKPNHPKIAGLGGALAAVSYFAVRLNHVIPGQISPAMKGLQEAYMDHRLRFEYFPSAHEWAVFAFAVAVCAALFFIGNRLLPLIAVRSAGEGGS